MVMVVKVDPHFLPAGPLGSGAGGGTGVAGFKDIFEVLGDCWSFDAKQFGYSILSKPHRFILNTHFNTGLAAEALIDDDFVFWPSIFHTYLTPSISATISSIVVRSSCWRTELGTGCSGAGING